MFKKFILNLRQKPKSVRDKIALTFASVFTAIIFVVWVYHAPVRQAAIESRNQDGVANESPGLSELFGTIGKTVSSFKKEIESASTTSEASTEDNLLPEDKEIPFIIESVPTTSKEAGLPVRPEGFYGFGDEAPVAREVEIISVSSSTSLPVSSSTDSVEIKNSESASVDQL